MTRKQPALEVSQEHESNRCKRRQLAARRRDVRASSRLCSPDRRPRYAPLVLKSFISTGLAKPRRFECRPGATHPIPGKLLCLPCRSLPKFCACGLQSGNRLRGQRSCAARSACPRSIKPDAAPYLDIVTPRERCATAAGDTTFCRCCTCNLSCQAQLN